MEYNRDGITVIDNFLEEKEFKHLKGSFLNDRFPWQLTRVDNPDFDYHLFNTQLVHLFYLDQYPPKRDPGALSDKFPMMFPLVSKIKPFHLIRIKANVTLNLGKHYGGSLHVDNNAINEGMTAIYYLNTCNGWTQFENDKIESIENRIVIFPNEMMHTGVRATDKSWRMVININWLDDKRIEDLQKFENCGIDFSSHIHKDINEYIFDDKYHPEIFEPFRINPERYKEDSFKTGTWD